MLRQEQHKNKASLEIQLIFFSDEPSIKLTINSIQTQQEIEVQHTISRKMDSTQSISSLVYEIYMLRCLQSHVVDNTVEFIRQQVTFVKVPVAIFFGLYLLYVFQIFNLWQERIAGTRLKQCHPDCPSNKLPPDAKR